MQIVFSGDNLHDMSNPVFWEKVRKVAQRVVKVKVFIWPVEKYRKLYCDTFSIGIDINIPKFYSLNILKVFF